MARIRSFKVIRPFIFIPPTYSALYKLEITRLDGVTTDDITDIIYEGEVLDGVTDTIGSFTFTIDNSSEAYTGVWSGNEIFRFYCDYATSATTARFRGRIEKVSYRDQKIIITGRSESAKLLDITVTKSSTNTETSVILKEIFDKYATDFTQININTSSTNVTVNWYQKSFWECIQELCHISGFDCYIDPDLDCHYFEQGTVSNDNECVVHESNLMEVGDFAYDQSLLKNRIIVYGAEIEGLPLFKTAEDSDSIASYSLKELIIKDENITTETQAQERADYELSLSKDPPLVGDVTSLGLATIQPGEKIRVSAPLSNLNPNYYQILSYKHKFEGLMTTTLTIEKEPKKVYHILRDRISQEKKLIEAPNPNEMRFSWNFDFDTDTGVHTNTEISDGKLKLQSGQSSGIWISPNNTITSNATHCELRANGEALPGTDYYVSIDGGTSWQTLPGLKNLYTLTPPGLVLKIKIGLNSSASQADSLALLYKT